MTSRILGIELGRAGFSAPGDLGDLPAASRRLALGCRLHTRGYAAAMQASSRPVSLGIAAAVLGLLLTASCDVITPDVLGPGVIADARDAAVDAGQDADGSLGCDLAKPFGSAELVPGVASSALDASMRLSPDELTAYFFSASSGVQLLYTANRARVSAPFVNVKVLANVNTGSQYNPSITADGLTLYFASVRAEGLGENDIFQAARGATGDDFTNTHLAPNLNTASSEVQPYVTHDGTTMYFVRTVATHTIVFRAFGSVSGGFTSPRMISELVGPTNDSDPVPSADGLTLYWSSDRPGGMGDLDVWQAHRPNSSAPFGELAPVDSVNTLGLDAPSDVSVDGCRLYMTSTRNGRTGIYVATRPQ